jgi:DNA-binding NtrC family response regulator
MDDLPLLLNHFIEQAGRSMNIEPPKCSPEVIQFLSIQSFPGNLRELKNKVYDAVSCCEGETLELKCFQIQTMGIRIQLQPAAHKSSADISEVSGSWAENLKQMDLVTLEEATTHIIKEALRRCDQNQSAAAQALGISRQRLARHLKKSQSDCADE